MKSKTNETYKALDSHLITIDGGDSKKVFIYDFDEIALRMQKNEDILYCQPIAEFRIRWSKAGNCTCVLFYTKQEKTDEVYGSSSAKACGYGYDKMSQAMSSSIYKTNLSMPKNHGCDGAYYSICKDLFTALTGKDSRKAFIVGL